MNIYLEVHQGIRKIVIKEGISILVNKIIADYLLKRKNREREDLRNRMIAGYESNGKNSPLLNGLENIEDSSINDIFSN